MKNEKSGEPRASMEVATTSGKSAAKLGRDVQAKIGQQLRAMYDDVVSQGVPDRFSDLLGRLENKNKEES
jgi:hypothetical protein